MKKHISRNPVSGVVRSIFENAEAAGEFGVPGYVSFRYLDHDAESVSVLRRNGQEWRVPAKSLELVVLRIRQDNMYYVRGPGAFKELGMTNRVNSIVWALVRLLPLNELVK